MPARPPAPPTTMAIVKYAASQCLPRYFDGDSDAAHYDANSIGDLGQRKL